MKIVFFGTPQFAAKTLQFLIDNKVNVVAVVTRPDKPKGRSGTLVPTPVKIVAQEHRIPIHQPVKASDPDFAPMLKEYDADLFIVVAYGEIIKQHLLDMPHKGCINVHASLLPKYRGAAPIQYALINGENESGITIMHMVKKMDAGDIIKTAKVPISENMNSGELEEILCQKGSQTLLEVLSDFKNGSVKETEQDESQVTFARKIELEDTQIFWEKKAQTLHNLIRGVTPAPGAWTLVTIRNKQKRMKILEARVVPNQSGSPGEILEYDQSGITIACGEQALRILSLQLEGKKAMKTDEFIRGIPQEAISFKSQ